MIRRLVCRPGPRRTRTGAWAVSATLGLVVVFGVLVISGPASAAGPRGRARADRAESTAGSGNDCLSQLSSAGECNLTANTASPTTPYVLTVPAGMSSLTVVAAGGAGANGDNGANGGRGGLVASEIPVTAGETLDVYVATGGASYKPGQGWRSGGAGDSGKIIIDSGGGGGASAVVNGGGTPLVVAGGGGGAGGSADASAAGGNGGDAGSPAQPGNTGAYETVYHHPGDPGNGGCANDSQTDGCGGVSAASLGGTGADGRDDTPFEPGGGGGAGYPYGGNGGGAAQPIPYPEPAGGGGGGGGQNYTSNGNGSSQLASGSTDGGNGFVSIFPGGSSTDTVSCNTNNDKSSYTVPAGIHAVFGIATGAAAGNTSHPGENGAPGNGALAMGSILVSPGESLSLVPGCTGAGLGAGPGGGHGGAPDGADDGGVGGGGSAISASGTSFLTAGGGGGPGGKALVYSSSTNYDRGGAGGNAGLGWGSSGAGSGKGGEGPGGSGGTGGASTQPGGVGDTGSDGNEFPPGGGGGGAGGGAVGGRGGDGGGIDGGGGGGGAGSSEFDGQVVTDPVIGESSQGAEGSITLISVPGPNAQYSSLAAAYNNTGISTEQDRGAASFDSGGDSYSQTSLLDDDLAPGAAVTHDGITYTWPAVVWDQPDNVVSGGQTIDLSGSGSALGILAASDDGTASGTVTVNYTDGSMSQATISVADWYANQATPGSDILATGPNVPASANTTPTQVSVYATTVPINTSKTVASVTLPIIFNGNATLHIFALSVGDGHYSSLADAYNNAGISSRSSGNPGDFNGQGFSYPESQLSLEGLSPGGRVTHDAIAYTWPNVPAGAVDNVVSDGQTIDHTGSGSTLGILAAATAATATGTVTVNYTDGTTTKQTISVAWWKSNQPAPGSDILALSQYINQSYDKIPMLVSIYAISVPIDPSKTVASVTLPEISAGVVAGQVALHIFALGIGGG